MGLHVKLRTKGISLLARGAKVVLVFYDSLERRIVVIMHTFKMYGHSSEHLGESHGSSPVTTQLMQIIF